MNAQVSTPTERREQLQLRAAAQRAELIQIGDDLQRRLYHTDRAIETARRLTSTPLLLAAGLGLLAILGPTGMVRWSSRALLLLSGVRRVTRWIR
jgi:hypothetical protein